MRCALSSASADVQPLLARCGDRDGGARFAKTLSDLQPEAARSAGDERDLAGEIEELFDVHRSGKRYHTALRETQSPRGEQHRTDGAARGTEARLRSTCLSRVFDLRRVFVMKRSRFRRSADLCR